jgi:hypothetical protein
MRGNGAPLLNYSLDIIHKQTFKDIEVVITDHSKSNENGVESVYESWKHIINIKYFRNNIDIGLPASNTNLSIEKSTGKLIKLLCQDDYLYDNTSIQKIVENFKDDDKWLASSYVHTYNKINFERVHTPQIVDDIYLRNLIGTPSCITIRDVVKNVKMDRLLKFYYDCEYYYRLRKEYGDPKILNEITMVNYLWDGQITTSIHNKEADKNEKNYILNKIK